MEILVYQEVLSQLFACILVLALATGFWVSYLNSRKRYLSIIALAAIVEASRLLPDSILVYYPDNVIALFGNLLLQFLGTAFLVYALFVANHRSRQYQRNVLTSLGKIFIVSVGYLFTQVEYSQPSLDAFISVLAVLSATAILIWEGWRFNTNISASRILFSLSAMSLFVLRAVQPSMPIDELFLAIYYMELIAYPIIIVSLMLAEVENTNRRINDLLAEKAQSEADLKFIVNNTLDIILVSDEVGLLQSWSQKAQEKFGYTEDQAIGKIHMDELFIGDPIAVTENSDLNYKAKIESMDGSQFEVDVRMQTVAQKGEIYSIYVLRETTINPTEGILQNLLDAEEKETVVE
ncbi:MAG: PAS domain S-box protein [Pseudomonadales bacterium]|nr:PAS domain S-box protein [Pseudomonadales bacterium]